MQDLLSSMRASARAAAHPAAFFGLWLAVAGAGAGAATAGERGAVFDSLSAIRSNWPEAQFSVDIKGLENGDAIEGRPLTVEYESALPGFVSYIEVTSHGDIIMRHEGSTARTMGSDRLVPKAPLGTAKLILLFSSKPLENVLPSNQDAAALGSDGAHAKALVRQIDLDESSGVTVAIRRYTYNVAAPEGGTEYTTRSIVYHVEGAQRVTAPGAAADRLPSRVGFEFGSDQLTDQGQRDLDVFGEALVTQLSNMTVVLEGHTDDMGTDEYNMWLSQRRAEAARRYLIKEFGVPPSRLVTSGKGKAEPVADNGTEAERSRNRRVDFIFTGMAPGH